VLRGEGDAPARTVTLHFGPNAPADPPQVTLAMREDDARRLREGSLDPQAAFLQGLVTISGDMGLALQIGTALFM
jgi:putative sterol carrier protein